MKKVSQSANKDNVSGFHGASRVGLAFLFFLAVYFSLPTSSTSPPARGETETINGETETINTEATSNNNKNPADASFAPISTWLEPNIQSVLAEIDFDGNLVFSYRWEMDAGLWSKGLETVTEIATSLTGSISTLEFKLREKQSINISDWDDSSVITKVKEKILSSLLFRADSVEAKSSPFRLVELALESNIPSTGLSEVYYTNAKDGIALYEEFTMSNILRNSVDIEPFAFREQAYRFARESLGFEDIGISRRDWGDSDWQYPSAHMSDISDVSDMSDMSGMSGMSGISPQ